MDINVYSTSSTMALKYIFRIFCGQLCNEIFDKSRLQVNPFEKKKISWNEIWNTNKNIQMKGSIYGTSSFKVLQRQLLEA